MKEDKTMLDKVCKMALVCAMVMMMVLGVAIAAKAETYALTTVVVSLDYDADVVECMDFNGNVWAFDGCEDWALFDVCSMTMDDMNTNSIYDDAIINCRYDGWLEGWTERVCE